MAGFLTGVFDTANVQGGERSSEQSLGAEVEEAFAYEQTVGVGHSQSVSFETPDGAEHTWSNSQDVTLTVGLDATLGATAEATGGAQSEDLF